MAGLWRFALLAGRCAGLAMKWGAWSLSDLGGRRLRTDRSRPFGTVFLPHSWAMGLQIQHQSPAWGRFSLSPPQVRQTLAEALTAREA